MNIINNLSEKINSARALDFGTIFNESVELFKKTWIQGFLLQIFNMIIMTPLIIILYVPLIGIIIAQSSNGYNDTETFNELFAGMSILYILFVIIGIFVLGAVSVALNAAFFRIMKKLDYGEQVETKEFFFFLKGKYLSKTFVLMLVTILIAIPSALLCYIPLIYVMVPFSFFAIIFAFNPELSVGDIVKTSFNLGNKKWLLTFGLLIVSYMLIMILTLVTCGLGSLFLSAFIAHPIYLIYKHVIGFDVENPTEETPRIENI